MAVMSKRAVLLVLGELCHIAHTATQDYVCWELCLGEQCCWLWASSRHCTTLHHTATHRNTLQHTATHCWLWGSSRHPSFTWHFYIHTCDMTQSFTWHIYIHTRAMTHFCIWSIHYVWRDVWYVTWRVTWLTGARAVQLYLGELEALVFHNAARALLVWEPGAISQKLWSSVSRSSSSAISRRAGGSCFPQRRAHLARA